MDCKIAIPSLSRADILVERTLKLILKYGIEPSNIYVFIIPSEYKEYRKAISDPNINLITGLKGIAEQRGFISEFFEEGDFILTLDDDIRKISELDNNTLTPLFSLKNLNERVYDLIEEGGTCGIYPCNNPFFMKCYISKNLKFVIGCMRWFINNRNIETSRQFKLLEDYEISLKYFVDYGKIFRLNNICVDHDFNGKLAGGLASVADRSYSEKKKEVDKFYKKYKDYCSINQRKLKTGDKIDIKFRKMRQVQFKEL
tara:strand:+ start:1221 stop:1991 length:771 start_codon:yes stop_codon:yes gene_type:complete